MEQEEGYKCTSRIDGLFKSKTIDKDVLKQYIEERLIVLEAGAMRDKEEHLVIGYWQHMAQISELFNLADMFEIEIGKV